MSYKTPAVLQVLKEYNINSMRFASLLARYEREDILEENLEMYNMYKERLSSLGGTTYNIDNMFEIKYNGFISENISEQSDDMFFLDGFMGAIVYGFYNKSAFNELLAYMKNKYYKSQDSSVITNSEIDKEFEDRIEKALYYINSSYSRELITPIIKTGGDRQKIFDIIKKVYGFEYHVELMTDNVMQCFEWKRNKDFNSSQPESGIDDAVNVEVIDV